MSTVKVNTLTGTTTAGSIAVTGEGNSTTTNLQNGLAKVWVNFNGTSTIAIRDSSNVASLTDVGTGDYRVNFTNDLGNVNFCITQSALQNTGSTDDNNVNFQPSGYAVGSIEGKVSYTDAVQDSLYVNIVAHGDLA